ncbi:hypothetical protein TNCV_4128281 [Trichonephila clavipes]|uniref:Uncharacterized protein n=1 Tax=Trichonephila clavipes TaxID=2585209 RepID=A0A8X6ST01_TRICX|nr:hypothetical protein TNCV_4128281 [Trichonephila clavipes]
METYRFEQSEDLSGPGPQRVLRPHQSFGVSRDRRGPVEVHRLKTSGNFLKGLKSRLHSGFHIRNTGTGLHRRGFCLLVSSLSQLCSSPTPPLEITGTGAASKRLPPPGADSVQDLY